MQETNTETFLFPKSRQYSFDETMEQLVRALHKKKLKVPGIKVELRPHEDPKKYSYVSIIKGPDFRLWFCRCQGRLGARFNDIAAVQQLNIPMKELSVFEDFSGPVFHLYVGNNWEKDKKWFEIAAKVNSKLNREPRRYLVYEGAFFSTKKAYHEHCGASRPRVLAPYLLHTDDLDREYGLQRGDKESFETEEVFNEFNNFFKQVLVKLEK